MSKGYPTFMKFNDSKEIMPISTEELKGEIYCVSDGKGFGLAIWANLLEEDPEGGHDWDEFDFKYIGCYVLPLFWAGPLDGIIFR